MSGFSAAWLSLREPYDRRARSTTVLDALAQTFADHPSVNIADLACGTGSTFRAVSPRLPSGQVHEYVISRGLGNNPVSGLHTCAMTLSSNRPARSSTTESIFPAHAFTTAFHRAGRIGLICTATS